MRSCLLGRGLLGHGSTDWQRHLSEKERLEAEEAEENARREQAEADAAEEAAAKELAEYEAAHGEMEREQREYEEAQRVAQRERREAVEARKRMEERKALFEIAECILSSHAARDVANRAMQVSLPRPLPLFLLPCQKIYAQLPSCTRLCPTTTLPSQRLLNRPTPSGKRRPPVAPAF
jgi:hypothetical protein